VFRTVSSLLQLQGAQLWRHLALSEEEVPADSDICIHAQRYPPDPPIDARQLRMLKVHRVLTHLGYRV
jgi:hypothetical protein